MYPFAKVQGILMVSATEMEYHHTISWPNWKEENCSWWGNNLLKIFVTWKNIGNPNCKFKKFSRKVPSDRSFSDIISKQHRKPFQNVCLECTKYCIHTFNKGRQVADMAKQKGHFNSVFKRTWCLSGKHRFIRN